MSQGHLRESPQTCQFNFCTKYLPPETLTFTQEVFFLLIKQEVKTSKSTGLPLGNFSPALTGILLGDVAKQPAPRLGSNPPAAVRGAAIVTRSKQNNALARGPSSHAPEHTRAFSNYPPVACAGGTLHTKLGSKKGIWSE